MTGCEKFFMDADPGNKPIDNFEILWNTIDTKYALFPYKQVDWDSIYGIYRAKIYPQMGNTALFNDLGQMLLELKDGHTDISSPFGRTSYGYANGAPVNYFEDVIAYTYLSGATRLENGMAYKMIGSAGYISVPSFSTEINDDQIREILDVFSSAKGIILDVRHNKGGSDRYAKVLANHFFDTRRKVEIRYYKTGPGHDDLGSVDIYFEPDQSLHYSSPLVVLTNRTCFSACNSFVSWMSILPQVLVVGDTTGGGGGTPYYSELPNGWVYRYSSNVSFSPDGLNMEEGIPPDVVVYLRQADYNRNRDTMIEFALDYILSKNE